MTIGDRISVVEHLSDEYISLGKQIAAVVRTQNAIYDAAVERLAPDCRFEMELRSAVARFVWADAEYLNLQDEFQRLTDRRDSATKELEMNRWYLFAERAANAGVFPSELIGPGVQGASH